ncbi:MAG: DUF5103 domain-containing protein [Saprospiraceae bacterium]|nr:DUF5103 domain-containing protein [Saprospiraceae bacterium]
MQFLRLIIVLFSIPCLLSGQDFVRYNNVYQPTIKSVLFTIPGLYTSAPIVNLGGGRLYLSFDELANDARYLRYRIEHCNRDWTPSDLEQMEFMEGFNDEELRTVEFSVNTRVPYAHYELQIPNQDFRWTKSGNYLLHVYDEDTGEPMLTRRFMVMENIVKVIATLKKPADVSKINTHHEIEFTVNHKDFPISNPRQEVSATVLQNYRWDNAITGVEPYLVQPDELVFNYLDRLVFPAGKEFRSVDIRNLRFPSQNVAEVDRFASTPEVKMKPDEKRTYQNYHLEPDINGWFVIKTNEDDDSDVEADYAHILFSLESAQPLFDQDVYLVGGFCDWQINPAYKMEYEDRYSAYFGEAILKQGVYDYIYAAVPKDGGTPDFEILEGNWHETENYYTILIYYRPFGQRYDRLIGVTTISQK